MLVFPEERTPIARLLTFLERGERLAHECAGRQALLASDSGSRRFLVSQARQEAGHALVFQGAIAWLAPKHLGDAPFLPPLETYRKMLDNALDRQDLLETLLAEQVILEGLGEAMLTRIEEGLAKRAAPFRTAQADPSAPGRSPSRIRPPSARTGDGGGPGRCGDTPASGAGVSAPHREDGADARRLVRVDCRRSRRLGERCGNVSAGVADRGRRGASR